MKSFYLVLPSNSCPNTQPNNKASSFKVDFENMIKIPSNYEVALTEYSFDYCPPKETIGDVSLEYTHLLAKTMHQTEYLEVNRKLVNQSKESILSTNFLKVGINKDSKVTFESVSFPFSIEFEMLSRAGFFGSPTQSFVSEGPIYVCPNKIDLKNTTNQLTASIKLRIIETKKKSTRFVLTDYPSFVNSTQLREYHETNTSILFKDLHVNNKGFVSFKLQPEIGHITMDELLSKSLGFYPVLTFNQANVAFVAQNPPAYRKNYTQYFIYASVVEPIIVGGMRAPLLRAIFVHDKIDPNDVINESIDNLMYVPVSMTSINNIEIEIRDDAGKLINFYYGSKSNFTLHFQPQQTLLKNE